MKFVSSQRVSRADGRRPDNISYGLSPSLGAELSLSWSSTGLQLQIQTGQARLLMESLFHVKFCHLSHC